MKYKTPKEVDEKFDEIFSLCECKKESCITCTDNGDCKQFIHQQRIEDLGSEIEWLEKIKRDISMTNVPPFELAENVGKKILIDKIISHKQQLLQASKK